MSWSSVSASRSLTWTSEKLPTSYVRQSPTKMSQRRLACRYRVSGRRDSKTKPMDIASRPKNGKVLLSNWQKNGSQITHDLLLNCARTEQPADGVLFIGDFLWRPC